MAVTKIHAVTATVDKAVAYICNPDKTDGSIYISSYACAPETAALDFKYTLDHCRENSPNKAYHLIQAFAPGEVSFDEAHQIGKELADKVLEGKYSYVVTTHIDKGHVHNHIIFCAADNIEHDKYHDCKQTYYRIRKLSDELCSEHNLSVIIPGGERGKKYNEWQADKNSAAWKTEIRKDINAAIKSSSTYEEFLLLMRAKGYEIKEMCIRDRNKSCHSVNHRSIETFFFLLAVFLLERFIYCVHHWNSADTRFCFREGYPKLTFCSIISPGIICNAMVYTDYPFCKIYILPP